VTTGAVIVLLVTGVLFVAVLLFYVGEGRP
jgi:hypothetical protein